VKRIPVTIYTDGSCLGNKTGCPGGWAAILVHPTKELVIRGFDMATTNNRMELTAVVQAVKKLNKPCEITVMTDSTYVIMTKEKWSRWSSRSQWKNKDLWMELFAAAKDGNHKIRYQHIYGHTGEVYNERCDMIAKEQAEKARKGKNG